MIEILLPSWIAGLLISTITGPLGSIIVWRKMSYFGDTLAHAAILGVALSLLLQLEPFYGIIGITLLLSIILIWLEYQTMLSTDTLLGVIAHSSLSLGLIVVSLIENVRIDLMGYLFGDLLAITPKDLKIIVIGTCLILLTLYHYWKSLIAITINTELAFIDGINVKKLQTVLVLIIAITITLTMKFVGALLTTALLIIPSATARYFSKTPEQMALLSVAIGMLSVTSGLFLSISYDTPAGPSVIIAASLFFYSTIFLKNYLGRVNPK